jgi:hypothetical protein
MDPTVRNLTLSTLSVKTPENILQIDKGRRYARPPTSP